MAGMAERTVIYTDGACLGNPGPGGWAWAIDKNRFESGSDALTTNQRMELSAVLLALKANTGQVLIVSDSAYVVKCFLDGWWKKWIHNGWRNSQKEPVKNRDIWEELVNVVNDRGDSGVKFKWVKGHAGNPMNEFVDSLATSAAKEVNKFDQ